MTSPDTLPSLLDRLADRGERWLLRSRLRDAVKGRLPFALKVMLVMSMVTLAGAGFHSWLGTPRPNLALLALLTFVLPLAWIATGIFSVLRKHPNREEALAIYDERLGLKDRLRTADTFLRQDTLSPFMHAAVADAVPAAKWASEKELYWAWGEWTAGRRMLVMPGLALIFLLISFWLPSPWSAVSAQVPLPETATVSPPQATPGKPSNTPPDSPVPAPDSAKRQPAAKPSPLPRLGQPPNISQPSPTQKTVTDDEVKETPGATEGGQHSDAKSSGRSGRAQGASGNQSPASDPVEQKERQKKGEKKTSPDKPALPSKKSVKDRSGATSGRGNSSGSSRNPASTDWSSKDRVEESEDQELEQEDEVDDEETESEARGGLQPNLRDRRPPVNRDLSIGFGNRANPDANGRGGPGQRKKSRGVASLVLGVPVPDHVKGQVNPGRVKITQERIQPKAERADPVEAEDRGERQAPYGSIPQRTMDPMMKQLVRDFFRREGENP